jgi:TetR/AcrR family transcriptional regulator, cholesterol catabolism regulator
LFREKGYAESTTREISERLGIQKASLYHHISTKQDLLHWICKESLERITDEVTEALNASDPGDRLSAAIRAHVVEVVSKRDMHVVTFLEMRSLTDENHMELIALRDHHEAIFRQLLSGEQASGRIRSDISAKYLTLSLLNLLNWSVFWFDSDGGLTPHQLADILLTIFLDGSNVGRTPVEVSAPSDAATSRKRKR